MGMYEIIVGIAVIILAAIMWVGFSHALNEVSDTFAGAVPNSTYVNQTAIETELQRTNDIYYFSFFIIAIFVFVWMLKIKGII